MSDTINVNGTVYEYSDQYGPIYVYSNEYGDSIALTDASGAVIMVVNAVCDGEGYIETK